MSLKLRGQRASNIESSIFSHLLLNRQHTRLCLAGSRETARLRGVRGLFARRIRGHLGIWISSALAGPFCARTEAWGCGE